MVKAFGIRITVPFLEEYLFENKVEIRHVEMNHSDDTIVMYFKGAGCETSEACVISEVREHDLPKALQYIKQCLTQD